MQVLGGLPQASSDSCCQCVPICTEKDGPPLQDDYHTLLLVNPDLYDRRPGVVIFASIVRRLFHDAFCSRFLLTPLLCQLCPWVYL